MVKNILFWDNPKIGLYIKSTMKKSIFTEKYKFFCEALIDARLRSGLTQQELSKKIGRPQSYVSKYEVGERRLDIVEFLEIASVLSITPNAIIKKIKNVAEKQ